MAEEGVLSSPVWPVPSPLTCPHCLLDASKETKENLRPEVPLLPGPAHSGQPAPGTQVASISHTNSRAHMSYRVGQGNRARRAQRVDYPLQLFYLTMTFVL